jgi:hypothetical protein
VGSAMVRASSRHSRADFRYSSGSAQSIVNGGLPPPVPQIKTRLARIFVTAYMSAVGAPWFVLVQERDKQAPKD